MTQLLQNDGCRLTQRKACKRYILLSSHVVHQVGTYSSLTLVFLNAADTFLMTVTTCIHKEVEITLRIKVVHAIAI